MRIIRLTLHIYTTSGRNAEEANTIFVKRLKVRAFLEDQELNWSQILKLASCKLGLDSCGLRYANEGLLYTRTPGNNLADALFP